MASDWYTVQIMLYRTQLAKEQISKEEYLLKVGKLMNLPILREKAPDWLHEAVLHLSKSDPADVHQRNVMKKVLLCVYTTKKSYCRKVFS